MLKWLNSPGISQCFRSINDFNGQLLTMEGEMARNLDEMYFCHASIFSMRSRPLEIIKAKDILARETYYNLPASMFSCGKPDFPMELEPDSVSRDLTVFIHTKLKIEYSEEVQFPMTRSIENGLLTINCCHYFRLYLTLKVLHEESEWCVLNCQLLNDAAVDAPNVSSFETDKIVLEKKLIEVLRGIASSATVGGSVPPDSSSAAVESKSEPVRNTIGELLSACRSTAIYASVKLLHQQFLTSPQCASYFKESVQVSLVEASTSEPSKDSASYLSVKVWKSAFHG